MILTKFCRRLVCCNGYMIIFLQLFKHPDTYLSHCTCKIDTCQIMTNVSMIACGFLTAFLQCMNMSMHPRSTLLTVQLSLSCGGSKFMTIVLMSSFITTVCLDGGAFIFNLCLNKKCRIPDLRTHSSVTFYTEIWIGGRGITTTQENQNF